MFGIVALKLAVGQQREQTIGRLRDGGQPSLGAFRVVDDFAPLLGEEVDVRTLREFVQIPVGRKEQR